MDITPVFRACIKVVRMRNKALGVNVIEPDRNRILTQQQHKNPFSGRAKDIYTQVSRLRDFLLENRKAYLNLASYLMDEPQLSDDERDNIDATAQRIMKTCSALVHDFKKQIASADMPMQRREHFEVVTGLLEVYLKSVCQIYTEQHVTRVKRSLETRKMSRLATPSDSKSSRIVQQHSTESTDTTDARNEEAALAAARSAALAELTVEDDNQLSPEELQMFESENVLLFNELNSLTDEVRLIEKSVVQIAQLQEVFTDKVLQQERDAERISTNIIATTENVRNANTQIREAIQHNAGLRVYILFILIVLSFTLLFLNWYND